MPATVQVTLPTEEIAALAGGDHDDLLVELERIARAVHAATLDVVEHAERTARFLADGHRTTAAWVRAVTNCSPAESQKRAPTRVSDPWAIARDRSHNSWVIR